MNKSKLLKLINRAIETEDKVVEDLTKHIGASLSFSGFTKEELAIMHDSLEKIKKDSKRHSEVLTSLKKKIEGENINVY